jgi:dGTP triphosphohydrolase
MDLRGFKENVIFNAAINKFGAFSQTVKAVEEFAELQKVLCKIAFNSVNNNNSIEELRQLLDNLVEEMADCYVMLDQLKIIYDVKDIDIQAIRDFKVERLKEEIEDDKDKDN